MSLTTVCQKRCFAFRTYWDIPLAIGHVMNLVGGLWHYNVSIFLYSLGDEATLIA